MNDNDRDVGEMGDSFEDWAELLSDPLTTIAMAQWARIPDAGGFYMAECQWSFEVMTPHGRVLDASGQFCYGSAVFKDDDGGEDLWR